MPLSTKKYVIDDISNAALFDLTTGDPVAYFDKLKKMTITIDAKQQREYGGTSRFAFHLTEQDSESGINIENAQLDYNQLVAATGATLATGSTVKPTVEKLTAVAGVVTPSQAALMVADSQKVVVVATGALLAKVASAPSTGEYTIASGVITLGDSGLATADIRVFYDYTSTTGNTASVKTSSKNKAYKFVSYGRYFDDVANAWINVSVVVYKAQMLGTFTIDQQRKSATTNTLDLAVLDAGRADEKCIDIIDV